MTEARSGVVAAWSDVTAAWFEAVFCPDNHIEESYLWSVGILLTSGWRYWAF